MIQFVELHQFGITVCLQVVLTIMELWNLIQWIFNRREDSYQAIHEAIMFILCLSGIIVSCFCSLKWLMLMFAIVLTPIWFHEMRWIILESKRKDCCVRAIVVDSISVILKFILSVCFTVVAHCI